MEVKDEAAIEPFPVQEYFLDGFCNYRSCSGLMFCAGFRAQGREKIIQVKLIFPVASIAETRAQGDAAMAWGENLDRMLRAGSH